MDLDDDVQKLLDNSIDIDLIKDEQTPMYQNVDIHRQRLLSVLDRALEKISIAYTLEEMLTENVGVLSQFMTQHEIDAIIRTFKLARRHDHEDSPPSIMNTVLRRSAYFKSGYLSSRSSVDSFKSSSKASLILSSVHSSQNLDKNLDDKEYTAAAQMLKNQYTHILAKLQFIPEIPYLAKSMISKKPVGEIKYYIYLRDLRNYVSKMIYETKTEEMNHKKNIKQAYVRNLKEKPQAEAIKKILLEKQKEKNDFAEQLRKEIENEKIIQAEMNLKLLCDATEMIINSEREMMALTAESNIFQEEHKAVYGERVTSYNKVLAENITTIDKLRKKIRKIEVTYRNILDNYDTTIGDLHEKYEVIYETYSEIKSKYDVLKIKFDIQEVEYIALMAERKELVEMTCLRIRYNRAAKIIQLWWRQILIRRWKWRKTYLAMQLKRKILSRTQEKKMKKMIKKLRAKEKEQFKRFKTKK